MKTKNVFLSILAIIGAKLGYDYFTKKSNSNTYIVTEDLINGVIPNSNGLPNYYAKKGQKINGKIETKFVFNQNHKGIEVINQYGKNFILVQYLTNLDGSAVSV